MALYLGAFQFLIAAADDIFGLARVLQFAFVIQLQGGRRAVFEPAGHAIGRVAGAIQRRHGQAAEARAQVLHKFFRPARARGVDEQAPLLWVEIGVNQGGTGQGARQQGMDDLFLDRLFFAAIGGPPLGGLQFGDLLGRHFIDGGGRQDLFLLARHQHGAAVAGVGQHLASAPERRRPAIAGKVHIATGLEAKPGQLCFQCCRGQVDLFGKPVEAKILEPHELSLP